MAGRTERQAYMIRYQDREGRVLTGATVRGETELAEAFADVAKSNPEITLTWRRWAGLNNHGADDDNPWRTKDELPPLTTPDKEA